MHLTEAAALVNGAMVASETISLPILIPIAMTVLLSTPLTKAVPF